MKLNAKLLIREYNKTPSLRILAKKYNSSPKTIKKYIIKGGGTLNFKKGNTKNYKANKGSFKKGKITWNKGFKYPKEFCENQSKIMKQKIKEGNWIPISQRKGIAEKISKAQMEKNNPAWKGGISPIHIKNRNRLVKKSWRIKVLKRDNYTCQECGERALLDAHHIKSVIKYPKLANDSNNGITLCKNCHYNTYKKEEIYEQRFKNIIEGFKVITIISSRPELIRQSLIIQKLDKCLGANHIFVYTGQNFDKNLYNIFFKDLNLRRPEYVFNISKKLTKYEFIGNCMINIEKILKNYHPRITLINILGDVNGAFASSYVCKRMGFKIIHNESGNRSGADILEEINRKNIDTMAHKLLCYTQRSRENLLNESYSPNSIVVTGNPLGEVLSHYKYKIDKSTILNKKNLTKNKYILVTLHRHETINNNNKLRNITKALKILSKKYQIILSLHPSLRERIKKAHRIKKMFTYKNIELCEPFNYTDFINLMKNSKAILSDSGGECEEACLLSIPCLVLRNETERTELLEQSQMILCGTETKKIIDGFDTIQNLLISGIPEEYTKQTSTIIVKYLMGNL